MEKDLYEKIVSHCLDNEFEVLSSTDCMCLHCLETFKARKVSSWGKREHKNAALCPLCGHPTVIGDASGLLTYETLEEASAILYERNPKKETSDCLDFIFDYESGQFEATKENESALLKNLRFLSIHGDEDASVLLAEYYAFKVQFHAKDPNKAVGILKSKRLEKSGKAHCILGSIYNDALKDPEKGGAEMEISYTLGYLPASRFLSEMKLKGIGVKKDHKGAFNILMDSFLGAYDEFVSGFAFLLPDISALLALCFYKGYGTKKDHLEALRYFLIADYGYRTLHNSGFDEVIDKNLCALSKKTIATLGKRFNYAHNEPVFDEDTFQASVVDFFGDQDLKGWSYSTDGVTTPEGVSSISLKAPTGILIVDLANLYCGMSRPTTTWTFTNVSETAGPIKNKLDRIEGRLDKGWSFITYPQGNNGGESYDVRLKDYEQAKRDKEHPGGGKA